MTAYKTRNGGSGALAVGAESLRDVCSICGQLSGAGICAVCADKIRAEALADAAGGSPKARSKPGREKATCWRRPGGTRRSTS